MQRVVRGHRSRHNDACTSTSLTANSISAATTITPTPTPPPPPPARSCVGIRILNTRGKFGSDEYLAHAHSWPLTNIEMAFHKTTRMLQDGRFLHSRVPFDDEEMRYVPRIMSSKLAHNEQHIIVEPFEGETNESRGTVIVKFENTTGAILDTYLGWASSDVSSGWERAGGWLGEGGCACRGGGWREVWREGSRRGGTGRERERERERERGGKGRQRESKRLLTLYIHASITLQAKQAYILTVLGALPKFIGEAEELALEPWVAPWRQGKLNARSNALPEYVIFYNEGCTLDGLHIRDLWEYWHERYAYMIDDENEDVHVVSPNDTTALLSSRVSPGTGLAAIGEGNLMEKVGLSGGRNAATSARVCCCRELRKRERDECICRVFQQRERERERESRAEQRSAVAECPLALPFSALPFLLCPFLLCSALPHPQSSLDSSSPDLSLQQDPS